MPAILPRQPQNDVAVALAWAAAVSRWPADILLAHWRDLFDAHDALLDLRTPATPSRLILTPFARTASAMALSGLPLRPQCDHFPDSVLLGLVRDQLAA
jgi:hypothetical protein